MPHTPRPVDAGVTIGEVFLGKYRVDAILGHGGMGVVALCTHLALNEKVAIKMLRRDVLGDHDSVERFMREAQAAVKLKSEYVARVSDVGVFENDVPYMVMEYLEGHDLGQLLEQRGSIPPTWACDLILQAAEALAEAHSIGIVHRDVKPTNLFVTWRPDGTALIKVLDFGISKAPSGVDMQLTQTQSLLGTPAYMSPEQMRSARLVDARSDIWSLGSVMYELLEGRRPFVADSFSEMCVKVAVDPPAPMMMTPLALQPIVLRCLEKAPEQRYASMADLARDLVPFTADPHHAQMMVERMVRMLRRAPIEWEPRVSNAAIGARVISLDRVDHDPPRPSLGVVAPIGVSQTFAPVDVSPPFAVAARPRRNKLAIALLVAGVLAAAAIAFVVTASTTNSSEPAREREPATRPAPGPPAPTAITHDQSSPAPPPAISTDAAVTPPTVGADPDPAKLDPAVTKHPASHPGKKQSNTKDPIESKPKTAPPEPCNPYLHPHGCPG